MSTGSRKRDRAAARQSRRTWQAAMDADGHTRRRESSSTPTTLASCSQTSDATHTPESAPSSQS